MYCGVVWWCFFASLSVAQFIWLKRAFSTAKILTRAAFWTNEKFENPGGVALAMQS